MEKLKCPICKKKFRKLHKVKKRGLIFYYCYKCYKKESVSDRKQLLHYHDHKLFTSMLKYYKTGEIDG